MSNPLRVPLILTTALATVSSLGWLCAGNECRRLRAKYEGAHKVTWGGMVEGKDWAGRVNSEGERVRE